MDTGDMQRKLSVWAEQDKNHRFFDLYHLLYDKDWLRLAHDHVAQNAGSVTAGYRRLAREELPTETRWTGYEARPGMADLRPLILTRDEFTCQRCGAPVMPHTAEIDHIRPVRRFKRPVEANTSDNLRTLCLPCHQRKTQDDRQMESGVR